MAGDVRSTARWQRLRRLVLAGAPLCWMPGCFERATEVDHIRPVVERPDLALCRSNVRPACSFHNRSAGASMGNRRRLRKSTREW